MKNVAALFLFGVSLVALCAAFPSHQSGGGQIGGQVRVAGPQAPTFDYKVVLFTPPMTSSANRNAAPPDPRTLIVAEQTFLTANAVGGWQAQPLTTDNIEGRIPVAFFRQH